MPRIMRIKKIQLTLNLDDGTTINVEESNIYGHGGLDAQLFTNTEILRRRIDSALVGMYPSSLGLLSQENSIKD